jgi:hypothetical protein
MQDEILIRILKLDLGILHDKHDELLTQLISTAKQNIASEGIILDETESSQSLVRMYAAWMYRQRANPDNKMPRMIRASLNNKLVGQKATVSTDV